DELRLRQGQGRRVGEDLERGGGQERAIGVARVDRASFRKEEDGDAGLIRVQGGGAHQGGEAIHERDRSGRSVGRGGGSPGRGRQRDEDRGKDGDRDSIEE